MTRRTVAIALKIPDNEAYTALTALRRLGVDVQQLDRAEIWHLDDEGDEADFIARVERCEQLFNPNKHRLALIEGAHPREGEAWIEALEALDVPARIAGVTAARRSIGWRVAPASCIRKAVETLLCNPAIERAIIRE
jgi:phosphoribosylformylglycinamidine (FGAM) synthase PurS component